MNKHYAYHSPFEMKDSQGNKYTLKVEQCDFAEDPREWDNLCTMICWHRNYVLGDKHNYDDVDEFFGDILHNICGMPYEDFDKLDTEGNYKLIRESDKLIIKQINMYEHSGITVSTSNRYPYNDRWDSCCVGFIYVTKETIFKECGGITEENWKERADKYIEGEMKTYDQYVRGEVYGYVLTKEITVKEWCPHCGELLSVYEDEEEIDSCWGFYGDYLEENGILDNISVDLEFVED